MELLFSLPTADNCLVQFREVPGLCQLQSLILRAPRASKYQRTEKDTWRDAPRRKKAAVFAVG